MRSNRALVFGIPLVALALVLGACGDDDSAQYAPLTATATPTPPANDLDANLAALEAEAEQVASSVSHAQSLIDEGQATLVLLAPIWGGTGAYAYQATLQQWSSPSGELSAASQHLSQTLTEAIASMKATEGGISGTFGYAFGADDRPTFIAF